MMIKTKKSSKYDEDSEEITIFVPSKAIQTAIGG